MTMPDPDWREQAYATFDKVMRSFLDRLYKDQIAPAMIEAGMDPARYRLEFAPLNPVEALHAEVMIKGEAYVSLPAELTTDIAADTETFGLIGPQPDCFRCGSAYRTKMTEHMGASRATEAWLRHVERDHGPERDAAVSDAGQ